MTAKGWIAREQILGEEARARCVRACVRASAPPSMSAPHQRARALRPRLAAPLPLPPSTPLRPPPRRAGCLPSLSCRAQTPPTPPPSSCCWSAWQGRWRRRPPATLRRTPTGSCCARRGPACAPGTAGSTPLRRGGGGGGRAGGGRGGGVGARGGEREGGGGEGREGAHERARGCAPAAGHADAGPSHRPRPAHAPATHHRHCCRLAPCQGATAGGGGTPAQTASSTPRRLPLGWMTTPAPRTPQACFEILERDGSGGAELGGRRGGRGPGARRPTPTRAAGRRTPSPSTATATFCTPLHACMGAPHPDAHPPHADDERHVDLRCWMATASRALASIGERLGMQPSQVALLEQASRRGWAGACQGVWALAAAAAADAVPPSAAADADSPALRPPLLTAALCPSAPAADRRAAGEP